MCVSVAPLSRQQQPAEYFDMGVFLAFFVVVSLVCLVLLVKIKLKQRRSQVSDAFSQSHASIAVITPINQVG